MMRMCVYLPLCVFQIIIPERFIGSSKSLQLFRCQILIILVRGLTTRNSTEPIQYWHLAKNDEKNEKT